MVSRREESAASRRGGPSPVWTPAAARGPRSHLILNTEVQLLLARSGLSCKQSIGKARARRADESGRERRVSCLERKS